MSVVVVSVQPNAPTNLIGLAGQQVDLDLNSSIGEVKVIGVTRGDVVSPSSLPFVPALSALGSTMNLVNNDLGLQGNINLQTGQLLINSDYDTITGLHLEVSIVNLNRNS